MDVSNAAMLLLKSLACEPMEVWDVKAAVGLAAGAELKVRGMAIYEAGAGLFYITHAGVAHLRARGEAKVKLPKAKPGTCVPAASPCQGCRRVALDVSLTRVTGNGLNPEGELLCPICIAERGSPGNAKQVFRKVKPPKFPRFSNQKENK
jgi:hypothetical protein